MTLEERIPIKVLFDRKDAAEWQRLNPVIDDGELVVELDTHRLKVGDGKLNYNDLPYYEGPRGESITKVQLSENGDLSVWIGEKETKLGNIKGQKGDKGTSITDITKDGETLTIKLSDDTQKTFNIPNGQKGDRGKSVESARVDEAGHLKLKIEEEQEKDLGNVKGDKGDSITITDQQRVSEGVQLTFSDETKVVIPKGEKGDTGDAKNIDLSVYATKAELKEIDVSKQLTDYLQKTEADKIYLKKSDKVELPRDLVKTGDIADVVRKPDLTAYATKDELRTISLPSDVLTRSIASNLYVLKEDAQNYVTWQILEQSVRGKANAIHSHRIDDVIGLNQALSDRPTTERMSQALASVLEDVVRQGQLSGYVRQAEIRSLIDNIGKLKDEATGQYLSVKVVDKGNVPYDTSGMIVFERSGGK
ncbi:TPA: hyaluronoglucosaminidase [Streptococcus equi subsp. zooepidemicus]|nr:hyaluronoglucosaminidase [Streptococcus equi subsp. zooepidemicus]